jgi:hypothetical protein
MKNWKIYLLLFALCIPAVYYLIIPGFYEPHDLHHIADIYEMFRAFSSGQIPPRWGPDFTFGYGYPLFNYYYILPFYLGALWFFLFNNLTASYEIVFVFSMIISVFGIYLFLREYFGKYASFAGALLYLYTPYRAVETYVRGAIGEALAVSFLPFVLWGIVRILKKPGLKRAIILGLIMSLFIFSQNYLWLMASPWLILLLILLLWNKSSIEVYKSLFASGLVAALISFYWWFPAISELSLVPGGTPFKVEDHFPFIKQLIIPSWGYGVSVWGPGDGLSFQIGIVNLMAIVALFMLFILKRKRFKDMHKKLTFWVLGGFVLAVFLMNIRSLFLWRLVPIYQFIQFPWRFLFVTTLLTSVAASLVVTNLKINKKITAGLFMFFPVVLTFSYFKPSKIFYKSDNTYLSRMFATRTVEGEKQGVASDYYNWSEDYLILPVWVEKKPEGLPEAKITSEIAQISAIRQVSSVNWKARVETDEKAQVSFNSFYFPGWYATVDGELVETNPGKPYGQIVIKVPEGSHEVNFFWSETKKRTIADLVSLSVIFWSLYILVKERDNKESV